MKIYVLSLLFCILGIASLAQGTDSRTSSEVQGYAPQAWSFTRYGNAVNNMYTGTVSVQIPVYTYKDKDFEIPVSINYASNGLIPGMEAGPLGVGWFLQAGGSITREIKQKPDGALDGYLVYSNRKSDTLTVDSSRILPDKLGNVIDFGFTAIDGSGCYDAQPDIYHFNFMGYKGTFHAGKQKQRFVYNTQTPHGEVALDIRMTDWNNMAAGIIEITTGDGYRYIFGDTPKPDSMLARNSDVDYSRYVSWKSIDNYLVSALYLSRIEAPNGRVVRFHYVFPWKNQVLTLTPLAYTSSSVGVEDIAELDWNFSKTDTLIREPMRDHLRLLTLATYLDYIDIDGQYRIDFRYSEKEAEIAGYGPLGNLLVGEVGQRLNEIVVTHSRGDNKVLKRCNLNYEYFPQGNRKLFLRQVDIAGEGKYKMDYYHWNKVFPYNANWCLDHWGYYNAVLQGPDEFIPETIENNFGDETILGTNRNPNAAASMIGMLKRITYPTKGYSEFEYQPNDYSRAVKRDHTSDFFPYLKENGRVEQAGGVRLWKIKNDPGSGKVSTREYIYEENGTSSGILLKYPRYRMTYDRTKLIFYDGIHNGDHIPHYGYTMEELSMTSSYHNSVFSFDNFHLEYTKVTEKKDDGSKTEFYYSNYAQIPDDTIGLNVYTYIPAHMVRKDQDAYANHLKLPCNSMHTQRGKLIRKRMLDAANRPVYEERYIYQKKPLKYTEKLLLMADKLYWGRDYCEDYPLSEVRKIRYFGNDSLVTWTKFEYNSLGQKIKETEYSMDGRMKGVVTSYVNEIAPGAINPIYEIMKNKHILNIPLMQETFTGFVGEPIKWLESEIHLYGQYHGLIELSQITKINRMSSYLWDEMTYDAYDARGNVLQTTDASGKVTSYVWGYNGLRLVAIIENAPLTEITAIKGLENIGTTPLTGSIFNYDYFLRRIPGALVTTYYYQPWGGVSAVIEPDGRETSYIYDEYGRLKEKRNDQYELLESYEYHVKE